MLIIQNIHKKFPHRVVEWGLSYIMVTWGAIVLMTPGAFADQLRNATYHGWASMADQMVWGLAAVLIGCSRLAILYINGAYTHSPVVRTILSFLSSGFWFCATVGVLRGEYITTGLAAYGWFMVGDLYSIYTSVGDAYDVLRGKRKAHAGN
tara:strand:- start:2984 stop:3436 length:453 start_codon:yes stop_codon:yes gene_type:complete